MLLLWMPSMCKERLSHRCVGSLLAVKDTIDVQGYRTTAATPGLARESVNWHCLMRDLSTTSCLTTADQS